MFAVLATFSRTRGANTQTQTSTTTQDYYMNGIGAVSSDHDPTGSSDHESTRAPTASTRRRNATIAACPKDFRGPEFPVADADVFVEFRHSCPAARTSMVARLRVQSSDHYWLPWRCKPSEHMLRDILAFKFVEHLTNKRVHVQFLILAACGYVCACLNAWQFVCNSILFAWSSCSTCGLDRSWLKDSLRHVRKICDTCAAAHHVAVVPVHD